MEKKWLDNKFKQYGVKDNNLSDLKIRMDEIPVSLAIAQAAKESGWGTSRFALEGNALFGQWTYNGEGIKPAGADSNTKHKVMKFKVLQASVRAYQRNLNTHNLVKPIDRVQTLSYDISIPHTQISQMNTRSVIDRPIINPPQVNFSFSYLVADVSNESKMGLYVNFPQYEEPFSGAPFYANNTGHTLLSGFVAI